MKIVKLLLVLVLFAVAPSHADTKVTHAEVQALVSHIERTMFPENSISSYKLTHMRDAKVLKTFAFEMTMKGPNNLLAMNWPATAKHKYLLRAGDNIWMYFSDVRRSIRLSSRDSFMGTDANNYDMMQLNIVKDYTVAGFSEAVRKGEPVIRVELSAKKNTEGYHRIVSWISIKEKRMLQNDCYSISGALVKSVHYGEPMVVGNYRIPKAVVISSHVNKGRSTLMEISNVRPKTSAEVKDSMFTLSHMETVD